jgi:hypothetical protein
MAVFGMRHVLGRMSQHALVWQLVADKSSFADVLEGCFRRKR